MELPHLTLYVRRLGRRAQWTWYILAGWALFVTLRITFGNYAVLHAYYFLPAFDLSSLGILLGNFVLYWVIAAQMGALAHDGHGRPPEWHTALISDGAALRGVLYVAALSALLPLSLLVIYAWVEALLSFAADSAFYTSLSLSLLRLPHFALVAGCLQLALRRSALLRPTPLMLATVATLAGFWDLVLLYHSTALTLQTPPATWAVRCLGLALAAVVLFAGLLTWLSAHERVHLGHYAIAALILLPPAVFSLGAMLDAFSGLNAIAAMGQWGQTLPHAIYAHIYPDLYPLFELPQWIPGWGQIGKGMHALYGYPLFLLDALLVLVPYYLISLAVWWFAALRCLRAARNPAGK